MESIRVNRNAVVAGVIGMLLLMLLLCRQPGGGSGSWAPTRLGRMAGAAPTPVDLSKAACAKVLAGPMPEGSKLVKTSTKPPFYMAVNKENDLISETIANVGDLGQQDFITNAGHIDLMVDIGANIGWFTLFSASRGLKVVAVEAMRPNMELLRYSICKNDFGSHITLYNVGVNNREGTCYMWANKDNKGNGIMTCGNDKPNIPGNLIQRQTKVPIVKFDSIADSLNLTSGSKMSTVMKVDIEGHEPHFLLGAARFMHGLASPKVIQMEINDFFLKPLGFSYKAPLEMLLTLGYNIPIGSKPTTELLDMDPAKFWKTIGVQADPGQFDIVAKRP